MKKIGIFVVLVLLLTGIVVAHSTYYDVDKEYVYKEKIIEARYSPNRYYSRTTYVDYDNDKRYSTYDYRHGYSYRSTVDYRDRRYSEKPSYYDDSDYYQYKKEYYYDKYDDHHRDYREDYRRDSKEYYYEYVPHLREYQKKTCYSSPPEGKLFYIKCP